MWIRLQTQILFNSTVCNACIMSTQQYVENVLYRFILALFPHKIIPYPYLHFPLDIGKGISQ